MENEENNILTDEEINAFVQYEAGNREYFTLDEDNVAKIRTKIEANSINMYRYQESKRIYHEIGKALKSRRKTNPYAIAASLLLLFSMSFLFIYYSSSNLTKKTTESHLSEEITNDLDLQDQPLPDSTDKEIEKQYYRLNEELENYVNHPLRGAEPFTALPDKGEVLEGDAFISWESSRAEPLTLKLYNNDGKLLERMESVSSPIDLRGVLLNPGLYYWSLENDDEVIHWSKFYLK